MSSTIVIYKSEYGATKQYAQWIAQQLSCELKDEKEAKKEKDLSKYDTIIYGGGIYAGGIKGVKIMTKNFQTIKNKKLIVFTVGLTPIEAKDIYDGVEKSNFTKEMRESIKIYHLLGSIDYAKLSGVHAMMMKAANKMLRKKEGMEQAGKSRDFVNVQSASPLVEFAKGV
ncbi:MAG: flavodoxin domain-containing protein [Christensenellaceae bacterium]